MPEKLPAIAFKVVDHVDALLGYWDKDQRCHFANAAYQVWLGKSRDQILGSSMKEVLGPLYDLNLPYIQAALKGEVQTFEREIRLPDGSIRHSLVSYYPDVVNGRVIGFAVQVADVTRLKELEYELNEARLEAEKLATHDFLTGLPNRVLLAEKIAFAVAHADRSGLLAGVAVMDFDGFKEINDKFGHKAGDEFLKEIARRVNGAIRSTDSAARLGGDEFIYVASQVESVDAMRSVIERLIDAICRPWEYAGRALMPSLSCGVAVFPANGWNSEVLLTAADNAMYLAKSRGKNRIVFAQ